LLKSQIAKITTNYEKTMQVMKIIAAFFHIYTRLLNALIDVSITTSLERFGLQVFNKSWKLNEFMPFYSTGFLGEQLVARGLNKEHHGRGKCFTSALTFDLIIG